jgi:hypothetical protein
MFTQSISAKPLQGPKNRRLSPLSTHFVNLSRLHRGRFKTLFSISFALIFNTLTLATIFVFASFLPKVSKVMERGCKLHFGLQK